MLKTKRLLVFCSLTLSLLLLWSQGFSQRRPPDIHFEPTPQEIVVEMLKMAKVKDSDIVYDLGCGDGRFVITAAKRFGARAVGIDIDPVRIKESIENAIRAGVMDRVKFIEDDLFESDFREATVVTLYLLDELNLKLRPKLLRDLRPGTRIVSYQFTMGDWAPDEQGEMDNGTFYMWIVPARAAGEWVGNLYSSSGSLPFSLKLEQKFQQLNGTVKFKGNTYEIQNPTLRGEQMGFDVRAKEGGKPLEMKFRGTVAGGEISGDITVKGEDMAGTYKLVLKRKS